MARVVVPGIPHHVTQRGSRRQPVFFGEPDYVLYRDMLADSCAQANVEVWGYCLMPNHVHLIMVPSRPDGLRAALAETHRRYSRTINERQGWQGFLWQGRFASAPMDEPHLMACARYVELNPVRAGLCKSAADWPWSSARAHLEGRDDRLAKVSPLAERASDWSDFLGQGLSEPERDAIRAAERTGRPLGAKEFVQSLETATGKSLARRKPGPKPR
jgi:putative transposase